MVRPARIIVGISGGISAYKIPALIRLFRAQGTEVRTVLTPHALGFVGCEALRTVSEHPVAIDNPSGSTTIYSENLEHIRLAQWAELMLIAPATANTLAKIASGIGDNLLTTLALSFKSDRLVVAPAMNEAMWLNPVTQENIARLRSRGVRVLPVAEGALACGDTGVGRMIDIEDIAAAVQAHLVPRVFDGTRILISSGPTLEPLDPVRAITNRSSGMMGAALARAAWALGAEVTVVTGPSRQPLSRAVRTISVTTAQQMLEALEREFDAADYLIMAAAVADFRPAKVASEKLSRRCMQRHTIELVANPDILESLSRRKTHQWIVGFALETQAGGIDCARRKMREKGCDMMVLNCPECSLERNEATLTVLGPGESSDELGPLPKEELAFEVLVRIARGGRGRTV